MPVCQGCGGSYDDKFKFCPYCGRATPEPESLKVEVKITSGDRFEICQIEKRYKDGDEYLSGKFYAEAIGKNGEYLAGESPIFWVHHKTNYMGLVNGYSGAGIAHSFLVNQLSNDGWEAVALSSGEWWQTRFQRRIGENYPKPWSLWQMGVQVSGLKYHFVLSNTKIEVGKKWDVVVHAKSREYKQQRTGIFGKTTKAEAEKENLRNLEEFSEKIVNDGFESIEYAINEHLKKCISEKFDYLWFYRVFLKRERL